MLWWWFWIWIVFIFLVILLPSGYGWRRGWGPPYPSRYRYRTRSGRVVELEELPPEDSARQRPAKHGWGVAGDLIWLAVVIAIIWIIVWAWAY